MSAPTKPRAITVTAGEGACIGGAFSAHPPHPGKKPVSADGRAVIRGDFSSVQTPARLPKKSQPNSAASARTSARRRRRP